jgi:hypothetical protein
MRRVGNPVEQRLCTAACARLLVILTNDYNESDESRLAMNAGESSSSMVYEGRCTWCSWLGLPLEIMVTLAAWAVFAPSHVSLHM